LAEQVTPAQRRGEHLAQDVPPHVAADAWGVRICSVLATSRARCLKQELPLNGTQCIAGTAIHQQALKPSAPEL